MYTPISVVLRHSKICRKDQETKRGKGEQRMQIIINLLCFYLSRNELLFLQPYRPVASIAMGSALTAMLDIQVMECSQKITVI